MDLSNEVLNIDFGQGATKISEVKVGGKKNFSPTQLAPGVAVSNQASRQIFFSTSNYDI